GVSKALVDRRGAAGRAVSGTSGGCRPALGNRLRSGSLGCQGGVGAGWSPVGDAFWGAAPHAERLADAILADITSVTNIGLIYGALAASRWNGPAAMRMPSAKRLVVASAAGLILGYSSRMSFGCNVGAFLDGIASASVHGWVWFAMAFAGS